jgi:hypothetical protein
MSTDYRAHPEPEDLTDEAILKTAAKELDYEFTDQWFLTGLLNFARAVIAADRASYARPAVAPVAVSERLPMPDDCFFNPGALGHPPTHHHTGDRPMTTDTTSPHRPTDEDLYDLAEVFNSDPVPAMRRALELWGQSAPIVPPELIRALELAEAGLADIGDAERELGDDLAWAEARAARDLPRIRQALNLWRDQTAAAPVVQPEPEAKRDAVIAAVAEALGNAYDCLRDWEAWSDGTMGEDDFVLVTEDLDRVAEIADTAIEAMRPAVAPVAVADRQPTMEAGDLDDQDRCWWGDAGDEQFVPSWRLCKMPEDSHFTHWRPHWAIPLPITTQEPQL